MLHPLEWLHALKYLYETFKDPLKVCDISSKEWIAIGETLQSLADFANMKAKEKS